MKKTHYDTLGVDRMCRQDEIRTAYRKLVLKYHPDKSDDPKSAEMFRKVKEAYEVLGDPDKRMDYDKGIDVAIKYQEYAEKARQTSGQSTPPGTEFQQSEVRSTTVAVEVTRLTMLFSKGRFEEAETLAKKIINTDRKHPIPYAVMGDILRGRGAYKQAAKMYAYASQMDPGKDLYRRRHVEMLQLVDTGIKRRSEGKASTDGSVKPLYVAGGLVLTFSSYLVLSTEMPIVSSLPHGLLSTWTLGLMVMLFFAGISLGGALAVGGHLDRFSSMAVSSTGRFSPSLTLITVAIVNFWAAALTYVFLAGSQKSFNLSTTRIVSGTALITLVFTGAAALSQTLSSLEVFLWGGNVVYIGSLCGWLVAESFSDAVGR